MLLSEMAAAAAAALLFATRAQADDKVTCYKPDGTPDPEMKPCDPTAKVSTCCRPDDFCLSNGLCLGGGGNNGFSQQGCTKEKWDFPCQQLCTDQMARFSDGYHYLQQCSGFDSTASNLFCCGGDYSCCNNTELYVTKLPKFSAISRAGEPTSKGTGTAATVTVTTTATSTNGATSDNSKVVAVGAGVGASLGTALLAVLGILIWQMRKQKKHQPVHDPALQQHTYGSQPKYETQPVQQQHPVELSSAN